MARARKHFIQKDTMFGYWKVLEQDPNNSSRYICLCTGCNKVIKSIRNYNLLHITRSCSCKSDEFRKETTLKKYGVSSYSQTDECKQKVAETSIERYGSSSYRKTEECQKRYEKTCLERYGVDNYRKSRQFQEQRKQTNLEKYGVEHYTQTDECKLKTKQTSLVKYGVPHHSQLESFNEKVKETCFRKYGEKSYFSTKEGREFLRQQNKLRGAAHTLSFTEDSIRHYCQERQISYTQALWIYREHGEQAFVAHCNNYQSNIFSTELLFQQIINDIFPSVQKYDRYPQEFDINRKPDFRLEMNNKILYVNIDGLFTHSELSKGLPGQNKRYHFELREAFEQNSVRLIQFREDELKKPEIIKSIVGSYFNLSTKIYARKCVVKQISSKEAKLFFEENHLMGYHSAPTYGLYHEDKLVCAIAVKRKDAGVDVTRFCNKLNTQVVGGLSKLLSYVEKIYNPYYIQSFVDLRYATGQSYLKLGFTLESTTLGWSWTNFKSTFNRLKCRANMDERKISQAEHAKELRWCKIFDAGQAKWIKKLR